MRVADTTARRLTARVAAAQRTGRLPSLVAVLVRAGEVVWAGHRGERTGAGAAAPEDVQYRLGSITKTFTAVRVHQLVAEDRLGWHERVGSVLGGLPGADPTVRELVTHTAGLPAEPGVPWWEAAPGRDWAELVATGLGPEPALAAPGQFHYSNVGFALLGEVVARRSGRSWWDGVQERVLGPLGMARTTYLPQPPAAQGYSVHPYAGTLALEPATDTGVMAAAGQAWGTAGDLARWLDFLLDGHPDVLPREALLAAAHPQTGDRHDRLAGAHGLGLMLLHGGSGLLVGHTGSMPGFLAACFVDHGRGTGAAVLCNATTGLRPGLLARDLLELLEECEPTVDEPWTPTDDVPAPLEPLLGVWYWGNTPVVMTLEGGTVVGRVGGVPVHSFGLRDGRVVGLSGYHTGEQVHVVRSADGAVSHLEVSSFELTRRPAADPG